MSLFHASIEYNPVTLRQLNCVISATFRFGLKMIYTGICVGLLFLGASFGLQNARGVAMICIACFLLPSIRLLDKNRAEQAIRRMNGKTLTVRYTFQEDAFFCETKDEKNRFTYDTIIRLVEQGGYLYLFPNTTQAYMIDLSTLEGGDGEAFRSFLSERVGLGWTKPTSLLTLNLKQLQYNKKNTRLSD